MSIIELIADIPTNATLRLQAKELEKQVATLQTENATLRKRVAELEREATANVVSDEFVPNRGVFFKRKPSGGYDMGVYCPRCRGPMFSLESVTPFHCSACNVTAGFVGDDLHTVRGELP